MNNHATQPATDRTDLPPVHSGNTITVSDCCGASPKSYGEYDVCSEDMGFCPDCRDHCEYIKVCDECSEEECVCVVLTDENGEESTHPVVDGIIQELAAKVGMAILVTFVFAFVLGYYVAASEAASLIAGVK